MKAGYTVIAMSDCEFMDFMSWAGQFVNITLYDALMIWGFKKHFSPN
jgi:hypothetical protein